MCGWPRARPGRKQMYAKAFDGWLGNCPGDTGSGAEDIGQICGSCGGGCGGGPGLSGASGGVSWLDSGMQDRGGGAAALDCSSIGPITPAGWLDGRGPGAGGADDFR